MSFAENGLPFNGFEIPSAVQGISSSSSSLRAQKEAFLVEWEYLNLRGRKYFIFVGLGEAESIW
jgi:predicted alpha/beta superfamily hydrolase